MTPRDRWTDDRIDDLAERFGEDIKNIRTEVRDIGVQMDGFSSGRRLTTFQILGLLSGFLGPIFVAVIAGLFIVLSKGTP